MRGWGGFLLGFGLFCLASWKTIDILSTGDVKRSYVGRQYQEYRDIARFSAFWMIPCGAGILLCSWLF